jgi:hypothetical protein
MGRAGGHALEVRVVVGGRYFSGGGFFPPVPLKHMYDLAMRQNS